MSNQPQSSVMNISPQNIAGTCAYKCDFSFDYPVSNFTATNNGTYLTLSLSDLTSPVTFNNNKYTVSECYLFSPSVHLYNNKAESAEFIISHNPTTGGKTLNLCIPLSTNGTSGAASNKISEIIKSIAKGAPSQGNSASQGISDFTINDFIPMNEFYYCSTDDSDVLSFGVQSSIYISQDDLSSLQSLIKPFTGGAQMFPSGSKLFVNKTGPKKGTSATSDDIYIDCKPTNYSEELTNEVVATKYDVGLSLSNIMSNPIFLFFLYSIIFIVIIMLVYKGLSYFTGASSLMETQSPTSSK